MTNWYGQFVQDSGEPESGFHKSGLSQARVLLNQGFFGSYFLKPWFRQIGISPNQDFPESWFDQFMVLCMTIWLYRFTQDSGEAGINPSHTIESCKMSDVMIVLVWLFTGGKCRVPL